jgi:hypothetical protein
MNLATNEPKSGCRAAPAANWHVYAMDGALLGVFMVSACAVVEGVEHPGSVVGLAVGSEWARAGGRGHDDGTDDGRIELRWVEGRVGQGQSDELDDRAAGLRSGRGEGAGLVAVCGGVIGRASIAMPLR